MKIIFSHADRINKKQTILKHSETLNRVKQNYIQMSHIAYNIEHKKRWSRSNRLRKSLCKNTFFIQTQEKSQENSENMDVLRNGQKNNLQGILKTRQSQLRKLKFQQYYLSSEKMCSLTLQKEGQQNQGQESKIVNSLHSKKQNSYLFNINYQWFNKRKVLPIKLRAKSHTDFVRQPLSEKNFYNQQNCQILTELNQNNKSKAIPNYSKNKIQIAARMKDKNTLNSSKNFNFEYFSSNDSAIHQQQMIDANREQNVVWKNKYEGNQTRKKTLDSKILKKTVNLSSEDNFKLSPWRNKAVKEDKQNESFF